MAAAPRAPPAASPIVLSDSDSDESSTPVTPRPRAQSSEEPRTRPAPRKSALKSTDLTRKIVTPKKEPRDGKLRVDGAVPPRPRKYRRRGGFYHYSGKHLPDAAAYEDQHATRAAERMGVRDVDPADDEYQPPWMPRTPRTPRTRGRHRKMVLYPSDEEYDDERVMRRSRRQASRAQPERRRSARIDQSGLPTPERELTAGHEAPTTTAGLMVDHSRSRSRSLSPVKNRVPSTRDLPPTLDLESTLGAPLELPDDADAYETASEHSNHDTHTRQLLDCVLVPADGEARLRVLEAAVKLLQQENIQLRGRVQELATRR